MRLTGLEKFCSRAFNLGARACLLLVLPQICWAAGTPSGTTISNSATLTYAIGASPTTTATSNISFVVDDKVNVLVAGGVITNVTPGQNGVLTPFTVTNSGNATQGYNLVAADAASGAYTVNATGITDNFDPAAGLTIYRDNDCNGAINGADAVVTTIPTLPPNAGVASTACLLVQTDIAGTQVNGDAAVVSLKATTVWPTPLVPAEEPAAVVAGAVVTATAGADTPAAVDVVLADGIGVVAGDIASDGAHSTYGAYRVNSVNVALTKTVSSVVDPSGTAVLMPNAVMTYKIDVVLTGSGTADNLVITDPLPANTAYLANSITVACISGNYAGGGACGVGTISTPQSPVTKGDINTDADYADFNFTNVNTVTVTLGNVTAPANFSITFKATIN